MAPQAGRVDASINDKLMTTAELASKIGVTPETIAQWRWRDTVHGGRRGPKFIRFNRSIRYRPEDVADWIAKQN
ncbi:hypothetical protein SuNHUV7_30960 (plasmid) [Pseudoseohaeicola sp. NH-UV-7]|uniref:helix-turn-helix transcriptional regulator n=1 Tax=Sulfitobacter sp. TBRI5 TaxID=2989732 RepID=UPI003A70030E